MAFREAETYTGFRLKLKKKLGYRITKIYMENF